MPITVRPVTDDELVDWAAAVQSAFFVFGGDPEASAAFRRRHLELDRQLGALDGETIVGTFRTFGTHLTLPGGRQVQASGVTAVAVRPTHRRHGILTAMIERDIADGLARGDVASLLYASEWPIYGRFGYGAATWRANWQLRARALRVNGTPSGTIEVLRREAARDILPEIYGRYQRGQPGEIARVDYWWDIDLGFEEIPGEAKFKGAVAIHRDVEGEIDGYVRYRGEVKWDEGIPDNILIVEDLHGADAAAELELWRYLAQLDLIATIKADGRRVREPLTWHLADARAARVTSLGEGLWLRPYDVARLLGGRSYDRSADVVIEVVDQLAGGRGPAHGRYRLEADPGGARCAATRADPDVTVTASQLGAALLGGTRLGDAIRSGGATEHRPGALAEVDALLRTPDDPWCSTFF
jgi:predicted acetyltransferase